MSAYFQPGRNYPMADAKTYLNVPYAEKDTAKALGARWDAANKKWYVPGGKDLALFSKWQTSQDIPSAPSNSAKKATAAKSGKAGVTTYPDDPKFVAYNGDAPPWD